MVKHLTIRNVPSDLAKALETEVRRRGASLNETVKDLLGRALGLTERRPTDNGLGKFAGGWSEEDLAEFERATEDFEKVDEELWK